MTTCIADKYPGATERLRKEGHHGIATMATAMKTTKAIDDALGFNGAASHWLSGRNNISRAASKAADLWVQQNLGNLPAPAPETGDDDMLMVVCPTGKVDKVKKVLAMLGCEVESI